jgi:hypothetical protein
MDEKPSRRKRGLRKEIEDHGLVEESSRRSEVARFLPAREQEALALWKPELFLYHLEQLGEVMKDLPRS